MNEPYYKDALKLAQKEYRTCVQQGKPTSLPVLDELVSSTAISKGVDLGVLQVPAEFIIGTKTKGRVAAFATNFMPILDEESEFADKWKRLCEAHLNEGIREPIKAYEYMNRYYVEEGNKRVSVLKFFDAITIPAHVIRVMPEHTGEDVDIYLEYIEFYKYSKINFLEFSKKGCYNALLKAMGKAPNEEWTDDERNEFSGIYYYFSKAYTKNGGDKLSSTIGDALLSYIQIYGFHDLRSTDTAVIKKNLSKMWEEVELHSEEEPIEVKTDPPEEKRQTVIEKVLSGVTPQPKAQPLKVAFIHDGNPDKSGWINDHEKGRRYVDRVFAEKIETKAYYDAMAGDPLMIIEQAIGDGAKLVFTTSPRLTQASLRAAVEHPDIYIMNCSLNRSHRYISCYYTRMYEAKFILGAIAGSLTKSDKIGYVCDYPIYGQIAGINAFALGAQMANPRTKVYLEWSSVKGAGEAALALSRRHIHLISSQDTARFTEDTRQSFGLSHISHDKTDLLAVPVWKWGVYYEKIMRGVLDKTIKSEYVNTARALNYYWGMSAGVVDIEYAPALPPSSRRYADFFRSSLISGAGKPFLTPFVTQNGDVIGSRQHELSLEQIIRMDYLAENVIGSIPSYDELNPVGKKTVDMVGVSAAKPRTDKHEET